MNTTNSQLRNPSTFATSVEWRHTKVYILELTEAESNEVSRLANYGYDCSLSDSCHDITWPSEGVVAYHYFEADAADVVEAYGCVDSALATCGMQSLMIKVQGFVECVV